MQAWTADRFGSETAFLAMAAVGLAATVLGDARSPPALKLRTAGRRAVLGSAPHRHVFELQPLDETAPM